MTWNTLFSAFFWECQSFSSGTVFRSWGCTSSWIPPYSRALAVNRGWTSSGGVTIPLGEVYWCGKINHSDFFCKKQAKLNLKQHFYDFLLMHALEHDLTFWSHPLQWICASQKWWVYQEKSVKRAGSCLETLPGKKLSELPIFWCSLTTAKTRRLC